MRPLKSPRSPATVLVLTLTLVVLAACTGKTTAQAVVDRSSPVICEKTKQCTAALFAVAYPNGVDECVTKTKAEAQKKYGGDLSKSSVCTDDELDSCLNTFKGEACPAGGGLPKVPCDC